MSDDTPQLGVSSARVQPFTYVFIAADDRQPPELRTFDGTDDEELRNTIRRYFQSQTMTLGQTDAFRQSVMSKAKLSGDNRAAVDAMLEEAANNTTFEIVPIVMPTLKNGFIGSSLYIDDAGSFKDLPMNTRASRVASRAIRGDAFLLSNHDDPAADDWARVDTTIETFHALHDHPAGAINLEDQRQLTYHNAARDSYTRVVTVEEEQNAKARKTEGNRFVAERNWDAAIEQYSLGVALLRGRIDRLPNEQDARALRASLYANRSHCRIQLKQWNDAVDDCRESLCDDATNKKVHYRLAQASARIGSFDEARRALADCRERGGTQEELAGLEAEIDELQRVQTMKERATYSRMFGGSS